VNDKYQRINELIYRIKNKDTDALSELFDFYKPLFFSSIRRCIAKEPKFSEYKEDMLQESFFVLEKLVNDYDPDLTYFSYFISTRIDINLFRKCQHLIESNEIIDICEKYEAVVSDPFSTLETKIVLDDAIDILNEKQKEAIHLYFFENLDQNKAAEILGIKQAAFSKRLTRALENLKLILGEDFLSF
jgi:RNA polymerase sigma factor (sigma-70 family)